MGNHALNQFGTNRTSPNLLAPGRPLEFDPAFFEDDESESPHSNEVVEHIFADDSGTPDVDNEDGPIEFMREDPRTRIDDGDYYPPGLQHGRDHIRRELRQVKIPEYHYRQSPEDLPHGRRHWKRELKEAQSPHSRHGRGDYRQPRGHYPKSIRGLSAEELLAIMS